MNVLETSRGQNSEREERYYNPAKFVDQDLHQIYQLDNVRVGMPIGAEMLLNELTRDHTVAIVGAQFGDEGKGRFVDNKLEQLLQIPGVKSAYVIRYQGGSNAGHTVYTPEGVKIPLHQVPSSINEERAVGIMDTGMVIHMEDLMTEIVDAENIVGDLRGRLILSEEAKLVTDLDRAEEVVNRFKSSGKSEGGTGRGISPAYANDLSRLGTHVKDLMADNWRDVYAALYHRYEKEFAVHNFDLATMQVPDLRATRDEKKAMTRNLGTMDEFLDRLESVRNWYIERDASQPDEPSMIQNTFLLHRDVKRDLSYGVLFEGAQAVGLHHALGRLPDVTSSDTSIYGIHEGTKKWKAENIKERIGVMKLTYMSSVGSARMPTDLMLPRQAVDSTQGFSEDQLYGLWVREEAHERGTTTGRYRDICLLDLELMRYNIDMGGIEMLAGTHLDIAREDMRIKVCTHYVDKNTGQSVPYQPGIWHQENIRPVYVELPGWDGAAAQAAQSFEELPDNAKRFLAFVQAQTATPITAVTNGPERHHLVDMPQWELPPKPFQGVDINN